MGKVNIVFTYIYMYICFSFFWSISIFAHNGSWINLFSLTELAIHKRLVQLGQSEISTTIANIIGDAIMPCLFIVIATFIPFCLYQWYAFTHFCGLTKPLMNYAEAVIAYADANDLKLPSTIPKSPWCIDEESESIIQSLLRRVSYRYVQSHYWDQGFLRYFQFKQIPQVGVAIVNSTNLRYSRIVNKMDIK